jgi:hypothetical protein
MISLRKPLGSLESPAVSGAGLSPLVDMMGKLLGGISVFCVRLAKSSATESDSNDIRCRVSRLVFGSYIALTSPLRATF